MNFKKIILLSVFFILFFFIGNIRYRRAENKSSSLILKTEEKKSLNNYTGKISSSIFIPYWSIGASPIIPYLSNLPNSSTAADFIYFGIVANENGIDKSEAGYSSLEKFLSLKPTHSGPIKRYLTLRMTNQDVNFKVLDNKLLQQKIIEETGVIAKQNRFDGVILDFELSPLPLETTSNQITAFISAFSKKTKSQNLSFGMTIFGDTFYRARPYDLAALNGLVDQIYIMMYDFSKASGEPGPNFPLYKGDGFPYSIEVATEDFLQLVPPEKITIIFGLYGYDWTVGGPEDERPLTRAKALTLKEIKNKFIASCPFASCQVRQDRDARENKIKYVDSAGQNHVVWYENEQSIEEKMTYLKTRGISHFSFWAWGYY